MKGWTSLTFMILADGSWQWTRPKHFQGRPFFKSTVSVGRPERKSKGFQAGAGKTKLRRPALQHHSIICNWRSKKTCPTSQYLATSNFVSVGFSWAGGMKIADFHDCLGYLLLTAKLYLSAEIIDGWRSTLCCKGYTNTFKRIGQCRKLCVLDLSNPVSLITSDPPVSTSIAASSDLPQRRFGV